MLRKRPAKAKLLPAPKTQDESDLSRFFANSVGMLCIAGFDGYFKRLTPAWKTALGWTPQQLQSKPFLEFVHPHDRAATAAEAGKLAQGGNTIAFENRYRCKDGSYKWLHWSANSLRAHGQIYKIATDITPLKNLQIEILDTSDREKERLGRELHDGHCQNLAGIAALSAALSRQLAARAEPGAAEAAEVTRLLNEAVVQTRELARGLYPVGLQQHGLALGLEAYAANIQALFHVCCSFKCDRPLLTLGPEVEMHLYRISQEAVNNAIRHGRAKQIDIRLSLRHGRGVLSIRDDGVGVSKKPLTGAGIGLHTMRYRARLIGASLQVQQRVPRGMEVACEFPLPPDPPKDKDHGRK